MAAVPLQPRSDRGRLHGTSGDRGGPVQARQPHHSRGQALGTFDRRVQPGGHLQARRAAGHVPRARQRPQLHPVVQGGPEDQGVPALRDGRPGDAEEREERGAVPLGGGTPGLQVRRAGSDPGANGEGDRCGDRRPGRRRGEQQEHSTLLAVPEGQLGRGTRGRRRFGVGTLGGAEDCPTAGANRDQRPEVSTRKGRRTLESLFLSCPVSHDQSGGR